MKEGDKTGEEERKGCNGRGLSHTWSSSNDTSAVTQIIKNVKREAPDLSDIRPVVRTVECFLSLAILPVKIVSTGPDAEAKERVQQRPSSWPKIVYYRKDDDC